jgi:hypothetical protein
MLLERAGRGIPSVIFDKEEIEGPLSLFDWRLALLETFKILFIENFLSYLPSLLLISVTV